MSNGSIENKVKDIVISWGTEILEATVCLKYEELKTDLEKITSNSGTAIEKTTSLARSLLTLSSLNYPAMTAISGGVATDEFIGDHFILDTKDVTKTFNIDSEDALNNLILRICNSFERPSSISEDEQLIKVVNTTVSGIYKEDLLKQFGYVESRSAISYRLLYPILIVSIYKNLLISIAIEVINKYFKMEK